MLYKCPQCGMTSDQPGMCPHCNVEMAPAEDSGPESPQPNLGDNMPPQA